MDSWTGAIGPALMLALGALLKWAGDVGKSAWDERVKARANRESEDDLLHLSRRLPRPRLPWYSRLIPPRRLRRRFKRAAQWCRIKHRSRFRRMPARA